MILVTGGAGFIGSAFLWELNKNGRTDIIVSDKLGTGEKWLNIRTKSFAEWVERDNLFDFLENPPSKIEAVIHMGACSSTTQSDADFLMTNNYEFSKKLWRWSIHSGAKFIYASSASTYGLGEHGYKDSMTLDYYKKLVPLNKYAFSKHSFDQWVLTQEETPAKWHGVKFFNVYGPNEYHKGNMASMVFHGYQQFKKSGKIRLFKSERDDIKDGEQKRDFVYIKDITSILFFLMNASAENGIYNAGSGIARSFYDLALNTAENLNGSEGSIEFIDMPENLKERYQYYTCGDIGKLRDNGYDKPMTSLEEGVKEYVTEFLEKNYKIL